MEQLFDVLFLIAICSFYAFVGGVYYERKHNERMERKRARHR